MWGKRGRKGKALVQCFLSCHIWGAPWEPWERWAASRPLLWFHALMLFTLSAANCFSITQNTRPVLFIMMILWHSSVRGVCYGVAIVLDISLHLLFVSLNHFLPPLLVPFVPLFPTFPPFIFFSACVLSYCFSNLLAHFSFPLLISPPFLPSPLPFLSSPVCFPLIYLLEVSSLPHCHQLLYTEQRVITFVLHRVSVIGFMPPSSASSAEKEIEAFCHRFKSYQWGQDF